MPTDDEKFLQALEVAVAKHANGNPWAERVAMWVGVAALLGYAITGITAWNTVTRDIAELRREFDTVRDQGSPVIRERLLLLESAMKRLEK